MSVKMYRWTFGILAIEVWPTEIAFYSGIYRTGEKGERLSTTATLAEFIQVVEVLNKEGKASFGLSGEDSAMVRLEKTQVSIKVTHLWDYGNYRSIIPLRTFNEEIVREVERLQG